MVTTLQCQVLLLVQAARQPVGVSARAQQAVLDFMRSGRRWRQWRACDSTIVAGSTHLDLGRSAAGMRVIKHGTLTAIMVSSTLNPTISVTGQMRSSKNDAGQGRAGGR